RRVGDDAELLGAGDGAKDLGRLQQLLGRGATDVQTGAARAPLVDHRHRQPDACSVKGGGVSPRASTQDDHVVVGHRSPPFGRRVRGYRSVPTRYLVLAALLTGLVILAAGAAFFLFAG